MALFGGRWFEELKHAYIHADRLYQEKNYSHLIEVSEYGVNLLETHLDKWPRISNLSKGILIGNFYMFRAKAFEHVYEADLNKIKSQHL